MSKQMRFLATVIFFVGLLIWPQIGLAASPQLGSLSSRLQTAPLTLVLPSISRAARRLRPLFERLGNALPDWHPQRMFIEQRIRLGFDFFKPQSLRAVGIDPTGPLYLLDDGRLLQPIYLLRLLPGGEDLLANTMLPRLLAREQLQYVHKRKHKGLTARSWAVAKDADPRLAYLVDGELLVLAPRGCDRDLAALFAALHDARKGTNKNKSRTKIAKSLLADLDAAPLYLLANQQALRNMPFSSLRSRADQLKKVALSLDVVDGRARLDALLRPSAQGRSKLRSLQTMGPIKVRRLGALSMWWTGDLAAQFQANRRLAYLENLRNWYASSGLNLASTLQKISRGQVALHLLDLEPQLPGLSEMQHVSERDKPFFITQAWRFPVRDMPALVSLQHKTETLLKRRPGQLTCAQQKCRYAGGGRVTDFGLREELPGQQTLQVVTGPGTWQQVQDNMRRPVERPDPRSIFYIRANAMEMRTILGRISLLSAGKNNDLRAIWVLNQWLRPALRGFAEMSAQLVKSKQGLRLQAWADLRDSDNKSGGSSSSPSSVQDLVPGGF